MALVLILALSPIPVQAISVEEIAVEPERAANQVGTEHTVTAIATSAGEVVPGLPVRFSVIRGPNWGVNGDNITDVNGEASFTYTSNGSPGIDTILVETLTEPIIQKRVKKAWFKPTSDQIETDVFLPSEAWFYIHFNFGPELGLTLTGITVVEVDLGSLGDSDNNSLEEVSAKIIMMELISDPSEYAVLTGSGTVGKIEELTNNTPGVLDIPPFAENGTAVSTFEFSFSLFIEDFGYFVNVEPVSISAVIDHKPPETVTWYSENSPVIPIGSDSFPGTHNMYWDWFVIGERNTTLPEVQLELLPASATNPPGTDHTVTAVYTLNGLPLGGKSIIFVVDSGPNDGVWTVNYTDAEGKANFTYTGDGGEGTDNIKAGSMLTWGEEDIQAVKVWETSPSPPPDAEVGGEVYPINKVSVLVPWIALAAAILLISGITLAVRRRRI